MSWADDFLQGVGPQQATAPPQGAPQGYDWNSYLQGVGPTPTGQQQLTAARPEVEGLGRYLGLARNAVVAGLAHGFGFPGDIMAAVPAPPVTGWHALADPAAWAVQYLPTTAGIENLIAPTGLLNAGGLTPGAGPYPAAEKYGTAGLAAVASAAPFIASAALTGGAGPALNAAAPALAGGVAGEAAHQIAPNVPAGQAVAGALGGGLFQGLKNFFEGNPFHNVADAIGAASKTPEEAGIALQTAAKAIQKRTINDPLNVIDKRISEAAAPLDAGIPPDAPTPGTELANRINDRYAQGGVAKRAIQNFLNGTQKSGGDLGRIAKEINTSINDPLAPGAPDLTWSEMRKFRSELGASLSTARPEDRGALESLYGGTTADLASTAEAHGLGDAFQNFNKISTDLHNLNDEHLETILSKSEPANAAHYLLSPTITRGGRTLSALRDLGMPVDEVTSSMLRSSPEKWRTLSPEAKAALVEDPAHRAVLDTATASAKPSMLTKGIGHLTGLQLGELVGTAAAHLMGGTTAAELYGQALGGMAGYALPVLGSIPARLVRPNMLGAESLGAIGGTAWPPAASPPQATNPRGLP